MADLNVYKINDVVDNEFIKFPLTLLANRRYREMSLEAKVVYALLLNRLTLSQRNGWINDSNEVYLIYTREEAAETLNITYKKAIAAFKQLIQYKLIIEQRRGRGLANLIYVLKTDLPEEDAKEFDKNFDLKPEPDCFEAGQRQTLQSGNIKICQNGTSLELTVVEESQDMSNEHIKTCQNSMSRPDDLAHQDMPILQTSNIYINKTDEDIFNRDCKTDWQIENTHVHAYVCEPEEILLPENIPKTENVETDDRAVLEKVYRKCKLYELRENDNDFEGVDMCEVFKMCIDRLYFSKSVCVGDSVLPEWKVREYLQLMDEASVEAVMNNLKNTTEHIKNLIGYIISVMLNSVIEVNSRWLTVPILDMAGKYTGFEVN